MSLVFKMEGGLFVHWFLIADIVKLIILLTSIYDNDTGFHTQLISIFFLNKSLK